MAENSLHHERRVVSKAFHGATKEDSVPRGIINRRTLRDQLTHKSILHRVFRDLSRREIRVAGEQLFPVLFVDTPSLEPHCGS